MASRPDYMTERYNDGSWDYVSDGGGMGIDERIIERLSRIVDHTIDDRNVMEMQYRVNNISNTFTQILNRLSAIELSIDNLDLDSSRKYLETTRENMNEVRSTLITELESMRIRVNEAVNTIDGRIDEKLGRRRRKVMIN